MVLKHGLQYPALANPAALGQAPDIHITRAHSRSSTLRSQRRRGTSDRTKRTRKYQGEEGCEEGEKTSTYEWMNNERRRHVHQEEKHTSGRWTYIRKMDIHQEDGHTSGRWTYIRRSNIHREDGHASGGWTYIRRRNKDREEGRTPRGETYIRTGTHEEEGHRQTRATPTKRMSMH